MAEPGAAAPGEAAPGRFGDLAISAEGKRAMRDGFGYEYQTPVQACAFGPIAAGKDVIVRAKTGAGKTLSFLLPAVERLLGLGPGRGGIRLLAVSPVRELSMQIFAEAERLLSFYPGMRAVCMVGGLDWKEDKEALDAAGAASVLLVATPGRLQTHIGKTEGFAASLAEVQILVLDEVDYLTSEIFRPATEGIVSALPAAVSRQSLFFSATISDEVTELMKRTGSAEYEYIDMLKGCDAVVPSLIEQTWYVVATEDMTSMLCRAIEEARRREAASAKLVAIFMTGRIAAYYAEAFRKSGSELAVFEIHAQIKKQETRTEASNQFRDAVSGILFTSDVSSRGLDYPGVTDVIQMGAPHTRAEYIHRLGRTGRGGKAGRGVLFLHEFERPFLESLSDLPLTEASLQCEALGAADFASADIAKNVKAQAYYSRINHVMRNWEGLSKLEVLREARLFAASIGALDAEGRPPEITRENAVKMGVAEIDDPCVHIVDAPAGAPQEAPKAKAKRKPKGDPSRIPGYTPDQPEAAP